MNDATLTGVLRGRCLLGHTGVTFIEKSDQEDFLSYEILYSKALKGLAYLQDRGVRPGDELVFQLEDNKTFVITFWACILGGIVAVPLTVGQNDDHRQKLFTIWPVLKNPFLVMASDQLHKIGAFAEQKCLMDVYFALWHKRIDATELLASGHEGKLHEAGENDLAFIQFSSGSTGNPKGVMLTHKNIIANVRAISRAAKYTADDSMLSWMPLTHDMGLIGFHINPLLMGMNQFLMPTALFVRRPALWLDKASEHKISILCSPNFGYRYVLKHCQPLQAQKWDLSRVRLLYNGAEPISASLCRDFVSSLATCGLGNGAMRPVYGLAEASLAVSISGLGDAVQAIHLDRNCLRVGDKAAGVPEGAHSVAFVNVGKPVHNCFIRITSGENAAIEDETIGHVQIKGDGVTAGYYNNAPETKNAISDDGWLRTGDLGFIKEGALYITGREKDVIFINGQNFYAHDVERVAEELDGVELNKIAVAGLFNPDTGEEEIIAFLFYRGSLPEFVPLAQSVKAHINRRMGFEISRLLPAKDIPRTTSGKLQRFKLVEQYKNGYFRETEAKLGVLLAGLAPGEAAGAEPTTVVEQKLLAVWRHVLKNAGIGVTDPFAANGGNSLKAAETAMMVWKEFGCELPLDRLHAQQTVRALAPEIASLRKEHYVAVPSAAPRAYYPASSAQKRLYYQWEADKGSVGNNIPVAFRVSGAPDVTRLEDCIKQLVRRHDSLRMSFRMGAEPEFKVHHQVDFVLTAQSCPPEEVNKKLRGFVQPHDLTRAPLFRIKLLKPEKGDYLLFADFHHSISDGLSVVHFFDELFRLYDGEQLPVLRVSYKDYAAWEQTHLQARALQRQRPYWMEHLRGEWPVLEMPLDFGRPAVFDTEGAKMPFAFSPETTARLKQLADDQHCTLHALLLSLYKVLLAKYTGQEQIVVGIPVAGRRHPDLQGMQGMFVNNLALRSTVTGNVPFATFLRTEHRLVQDALDHQDYPFEALVAELGAKRDMSRNAAFDTMFNYQNIGTPALQHAGIALSRHFFDPGFSKFDISLEVFEAEDALQCAFEYATRLFRPETIAGLVTHLGNLVERVIANPGSDLADLSLLTDAEYDRLIVRFNATGRNYPHDRTIPQLFEEQAAATPARVALEYLGQTLTYQELDRRAGQLAALLREKGIVANRIVAVLIDRSPELVVAILGVLKAGGCYLPIDTDSPEVRIGYLLADSQSRLILTTANQAHRLANLPGSAGNRNIDVVKVDAQPRYAPHLPPVPAVNTPTDLAYVMYTSGTTGQPKGVMIEHRSLVNYTCWAAEHYVKNEEAAFPLFTSISFDLTVTSLFTPLITGNRLVIYPEGGGTLLEQVIRDNQVQVIKLTPSHLKMLRELRIDASRTRIKRFIVGGEQLEARLAGAIREKFGGKVEIYNEYGPTEATVGCMIHLYEPAADTGTSVPIGRPAANTQLYILDRYLKPVPTGVSGELYLSGDGLAKGYLFREALTGQKFVPNPFGGGKTMYRTGDVARHRPSGVVEYVGRADQQIKINGVRVEPAEIESHLMSHPLIAEALVTLRANEKGNKQLCAYYSVHPGGAAIPREAALRDHLAGRVPHYLIPVHFICIESIPLNRNGKVDHAALPDPEPEAEGTESLVTGEIETQLLKVWGEVLGEEKVRVTDNFFELGGDSIKAVQIASRLFEQGISVDAKAILTYQRIEYISLRAKVLKEGSRYQQSAAEGQKCPAPIESWFFNQHFANPNFYNQSVLLHWNGKADAGLLTTAFEKLVEHHDGLRINYDPAAQTLFYNNSHLEKKFTLPEITVASPLNPGPQWADAAPAPDAPYARLKAGFHLTETLLLKAALVKDAAGGEALFITAHHLVTDGLSWRILLEDLCTLYRALGNGDPVKLPPKTATLLDWEKALTQYRESGALEHEEKYWQETEATPFAIPLDVDTQEWKVIDQQKVNGVLTEAATSALLKEATQAYQLDVPALLNVALALTLRDWTGLDEFVVEQENYGRHLEGVDVSRTVGWFTAMYPVRLTARENTLGSQISVIKDQLKQVPNKGIGYGIRKYLGKHGTGSTLTEVRLNYLGQFGRELNNEFFSYSPQSTGSEVDPGNHMTCKVEVIVMVVGGKMHIEINYNRAAHKQSTMHWFRDTLLGHIASINEHTTQADGVYFTPSDFSAIGLNDEDLSILFH
jgi:surfactin family lipopeptide synthetase A